MLSSALEHGLWVRQVKANLGTVLKSCVTVGQMHFNSLSHAFVL